MSSTIRTFRVRLLTALLAQALCSGAARANCVADITAIPNEAIQKVFFPNWQKAYAGAFTLLDWGAAIGGACAGAPNCSVGGCGGTNSQMMGLTIVNFGSAVAGTDITAVYWRSDADAAGFYHTMTAVGAGANMWTWVWNGVEANPNMLATPNLRIYADLGPTATDGTTVQLGIPYDPVSFNGGLTDTGCCSASFTDVSNPAIKYIYAVYKEVDKLTAAPGDTLNYTIYYLSLIHISEPTRQA